MHRRAISLARRSVVSILRATNKADCVSCVLGTVALVTLGNVQPARAGELVTNGDFSAGNSGFTTGYTYISTGQSETPGTYAVRTLSIDFNPGYNTFGDHTTGAGNMMLVDGLGSGTTAWSETIAVSPNSNTVFSTWATTSDDENLPILSFAINGTQLGSNLSLPGVTSGSDWVDFTDSWNSGASSSATITITDVNSTPLTTGNDFALDDISFTATPAPEPAAAGTFAVGTIALLLRRRRAFKAQSTAIVASR